MVDVSKAIYAGEWELYPHDGKVELQDHVHPKIVLSDEDAMRVWQALNTWVERNAREE